ncbi:Proposed peptidoglycan lipid II flippase MurJ [Aequoribacter fuscus]|uniref:Probable lipid II flippase MurJ n=1 Tax=Aequoribacter fuscus TaxID=2518989 RepID=F3L1J8_9GAMM|nr:murein biosynthesis integral membrane protein MurJ [Aequoribacter fuscus]EGG29794.1 Proposed peptidoglycan lipid II flippase MurJ [Aequoribacter fuscus]QHJ87638.1 murein biosynthesis integral membrane protein MurJ [Aequoribacter fuscus]
MDDSRSVVSSRPSKGGLLGSSAIVASMTFLSRILGLIRDVVLAGFIGATANADAFFVAFKIPNFLRRLFAEGAFAQAFIPVLADYRASGDEQAIQQFINKVTGMLGGVLIAVTAFMMVAAPVVTAIFAPGFVGDSAKFTLTAEMLRITFPYLLFISLTGVAGAILNSYGYFAVPAVTPVLLNICLIGAALVAAPWFEPPIMALAWGVFAAGACQLTLQLPFLSRIQRLPKPVWDRKDEGVRRVLWLMVPALFGVSVSQINLLLDTVLASLLPSGSVSWLYYSDRLTELPLGVFGIAIATVILPNLSDLKAQQNSEQAKRVLDWAVRMVVLIALPATVALWILSEPILITLFQYGAMQEHDIAMATLSMRAYALGLLAFMLIKVLAPGFYAQKDTKTPVKIGVIAMVSNMVLNVAFVFPLMHWYDVGHVGLALATSCSAFINAGLLMRGLRARDLLTWQAGWVKFLVTLILALVLMSAVLLLIPPLMQDFAGLPWWRRSVQLAGLVVAGALSFGIVAYFGGIRLAQLRSPSL